MNYKITYNATTLLTYNWYNQDIISIDSFISNSLISSELTADTVTFTVKETDILTNNYTYGSVIEIRKDDENGNAYDTLVGKFYLSSIDRIKVDQFKFNCVSSVGLLIKMPFKGGVYFNETAGDVIDAIMADTNISYTIDSLVENITISGWLPYGNKRDSLQQVLFAVGANIYKDNQGALEFKFNDSLEPTVIPDNRIFEGGSFNTTGKATSVEVTEHTYYEPDPMPEAEELYKHSGVAADNALIVFDEPVIISTITGTSGITFIEKGNNYVIFSGSGTISGVKYSHQKNIVSWSDSDYDTENSVSVSNAYLVSALNSTAVLNRVKSYYINATEVDCGIVLADEKPGQLVLFTDPFNNPVTGYISDMDISTSAIMKAETTLVTDWRPQQPGVQFDACIEYTTTGTYNKPADYVEGTPVRFVIAQGGHGGMGGTFGQAGNEADRSTDPASYPDNPVSEHPPGDGGNGGTAGTAREEGVYVNVVDLTTLADTYGITIGAGGAGSNAVQYGATQTEGALGTHSTLSVGGTAYTSLAGSEVYGGFINALTGVMYGKAGKDGIDGGKGGKGGENNKNGSEGNAVTWSSTTYQGGQGGSKAEGYSGGGGGGAAYNNNGLNGATPAKYNTAGTIVYTGNGGNGATAYAWPALTIPCSSGNGGCGGGGGGGEGFSYNWVSPSGSKTAQRRVNPAVGSGGGGSKGQDGADGLVLLYYNKSSSPTPTVSAIIMVSGVDEGNTVTATCEGTTKTAYYQAGYYIFANMTAGTWTIQCTGYIDGSVQVTESTTYTITLQPASTDAYIRVNAPATGLNIVATNTVTFETTTLTWISSGVYGATVDAGTYTINSIDYSESEFTLATGQTQSFTWIYGNAVISGPDSSATNVKVTLDSKEITASWSTSSSAWEAYGMKSGTWTVSADNYQSGSINVISSSDYPITLIPVIPTIDTTFTSKGSTWTEVGLAAAVSYTTTGARMGERAAGSAMGSLTPPDTKLTGYLNGGYINIPWAANGNWEIEVQLYNYTTATNRTGGPIFQIVDANDNNIFSAYLIDSSTSVFCAYTGALNSSSTVYYASNTGGSGSTYQNKRYTYKFTYNNGNLTVLRDNVQTYTGTVALPAVANIRCWYTSWNASSGAYSRTAPQFWDYLKAYPI